MDKWKNWVVIGLRGTLFLFLPILLVFYLLYEAVFGASMNLEWGAVLVYFLLLSNWAVDKYKNATAFEEVQDRNKLEKLIMENRWEIHDRDGDQLSVRPMFDYPMNIVFKDIVRITYKNGEAVIKGPSHYVIILSEEIREEKVSPKKKPAAFMKFLLVAMFGALPLLMESGIWYEIQVLYHNIEARGESIDDEPIQNQKGNTVGNIHNSGYGVEGDADIFYVDLYTDVVRTDKEFQEQEVIISIEEPMEEIENLNLVDDWLYYSRGEALHRVRTDGTRDQKIYDLGYLFDVHIKDGWIYFLNGEDNMNVYRMTTSGQDLERLLDVSAMSLSLYDDELLVSHLESGNPQVESIRLDGSVRKVELPSYAYNLIKQDEYYYYIGEDSRLYRTAVGTTRGRQPLTEDKVSNFIVTEESIVYMVKMDDYTQQNNVIYYMPLDGGEKKQLRESGYVRELSLMMDSVFFHDTFRLKQFDLDTHDIREVID